MAVLSHRKRHMVLYIGLNIALSAPKAAQNKKRRPAQPGRQNMRQTKMECLYYMRDNTGCQEESKMATLYEIDARIGNFQFETNPDTGEVLNFEALEALQMERESKIENIACLYKNLVADAKAIKGEEAALKKRREALERKADWMKRYLSESLKGQRFSSPRAAVSFHSSESVQIDDAELAIATLQRGGYEDAVRYKTPEIDKTKVKKLLKDGVSIPGLQIVKMLSAQIK